MQPGIYRHWRRRDLYFVEGTILNIKTKERLVSYYSLYVCGERKFARPQVEFTEYVDKDDYKGPRFTKVLDWSSPNIIPGQVILRRKNLFRWEECTVLCLFENFGKVEMELSGKPKNYYIPLEDLKDTLKLTIEWW